MMFRLSLVVLIALFNYKCYGEQALSLAHFGVSLLQHSSQPDEQAVISPIVESLALGAVYEGAKNETRKEIGDVMFGPKSEEQFASNLQFLHSIPKSVKYHAKKQKSVMKMLLLTHKRFKYKDEFLNSMKTNYKAALRKYDFCEDEIREKAAQETENWVKKATGNVVKDTVEKRMFRTETRSAPISAISTCFRWKNPLTKEIGEFGGKRVNFLKGCGEYRYQSTPKYEVLGMEMVDDAAVLYIFLPKSENYEEFVEYMDGARVLHAEFGDKMKVEVKIPEMKIFSKHRFHVALKKLGVEKVFTEDAELDHLGVQATDMYASYQAVGFEVNEHLVRGGATGTAGLQSLSGIVGPPMEKEEKVHNEEYEVTDEVTKRFVADRPFFFALVRDDLILYAGHYM
uniref:Putative serpin n=1 Tax=Gnathostoma spinigerum TaxID=75299 RepID=A0A6G7H9Y5_9BILA|nr:putative serpin [Gnathostoma spinigerum]